ncbi:hypothetical protein EX895_004353 [Sporisorium graminicola]|uniref:Ketoreductase (KR) domain-containing protein n=1 Tax=Sporisorium graminicola TaxID=280036 RepID=A0A4U7KQX5_9BASI|nr:hypothetical protein EX895_004353 [Sporisorium graminicola]TKY86713.1 hypothetical protein EX895_004353 [Sporisorium graminicola]
MSVRIIATGGHSGLGFEALKTLLASPALAAGCSVTLMVRDEQAPPVTLARRKLIEQYNAARPAATTSSVPRLSVDTLSMDLSSLPSVRKAAAAIQTQLQTDVEPASGQDIFLLNAAVAKSSRETVIDADRASGSVSYPSDHLVTDDSHIETSACVNHIAHLVFISSLVPTITANAKKGRKTRIVFTGSALHRSVKYLSVLGSYFSSSSHDSSSPWTLRETYAASKFLQMLGVRALRHRIEASLKAAAVPSDRVEVVVVQPGFVPQTGLSRESSLLTRFAMSYVLPWAPFTTSLDDAGKYIADACIIDLSSSEVQSDGQDGFHSQDTHVRSALLEVHARKQRFGTLDPRTADVQLQQRWWPSACDLF